MVEGLLFTAGDAAASAWRAATPQWSPARGRAGCLLVVALRGGAADLQPDAFSVRVLDVGQGDAILLDPPGGDPCSWTPGRPAQGSAHGCAGSECGSPAWLVTHDSRTTRAVCRRCSRRYRPPAGTRSRRGGVGRAGTGRARCPCGPRRGRSCAPAISACWCCGRRANCSACVPTGIPTASHSSWSPSGGTSRSCLWRRGGREVPIDPGPVDVIKIAHHGSAARASRPARRHRAEAGPDLSGLELLRASGSRDAGGPERRAGAGRAHGPRRRHRDRGRPARLERRAEPCARRALDSRRWPRSSPPT